ncbi:MAG: type I restriction-modification system subunit M [Candidatus Delongbacteria bacterium]|nr:type I restriction-modification system subunit M [Candidatus Delongbacteria bacterium]MCG2760489.1 type I restriction-modification system subunit M [Candidatus Delongbacteria bacterium]
MTKQKLEQKLWDIANTLRGNMGADEFRDYILGFIFYKFLSEKIEKFVSDELTSDKLSFEEAMKDKELSHDLKEECIEDMGFFIEPTNLFSRISERAKNREFIIEDLGRALKSVEEATIGHKSEEDFAGLFEDVDLTSTKLGRTVEQKNKLISEVIKHIAEVDFNLEDTEADVLGDAYEYLISQFASGAGKKAGEFYTPQQVSKILAKIVTTGKTRLKSAYDPTCGSGSLLLRVAKERKVSDFYGQELNTTTFNLARMNMILHSVKYNDFHITQGDTLEEPHDLDKRFEAVVANPPFSAHWSANQTFLSDERFSPYGKLAPKTKADFAFVQHMLYQLDENGIMAIVLPHGVLFRGAAEGEIRKYIIEEKNWLDAVIGLPANIFYGTSIPTVILVFKKCRTESDSIHFIDASRSYEKVKNQNNLRDEDVEKIISTYRNRTQEEKYSYSASIEQIRQNDYNLNIPRYVDTFEEEDEIDLDKIALELKNIEADIKLTDKKIIAQCKELGITPPVFGDSNE